MPLIKWESPIKRGSWGDVDRLLDEIPIAAIEREGWGSAVDVYEEEGNIVARMQLPGVDPAKIDVTVEGDQLRIKGAREEEEEERDKQFYSKEIRKGSFEHTLVLPAPVEKNEVEATYERGELKVILPIKERKGSSGRVEVKVRN